MSENTRGLSADILIKVLDEHVRLGTALHECMNKKPGLSKEERAFITMLVTGTVERCIELDYIINMYSSKAINKQKPYIRAILRMSVYQIRYMDSIPDSAAVNEAVKLAARKGFAGLKGFVNGLLRNIARNNEQIKYPDPDKNIIQYLSVFYSVPECIVEHYLSEMNREETEKTLQYFLENSDTVIRFTKHSNNKIDSFEKNGIKYSKGHIFDYAYRLNNPGRIDMLPGYENGDFVVQDESSMIPGHIAVAYIKNILDGFGDNTYNNATEYNKVIHVLDMCAAPGGKTLHIADELGSVVHIDSCDISEYKINKIKENAKRLKLDNIRVSINDALQYDASKNEKYNIVIADLPCSGLGVLSGKPDIKYNIKKEDMTDLSEIQHKILKNAARYVLPEGLLIYSTCTLDRMENEYNADRFIKDNTDYELVDPVKIFGDDILRKLTDYITQEGYIKIIPGIAGSDGFFVAIFKKIR